MVPVSIALSILHFVTTYVGNHQVEGGPKEVIPVPGWFNDVEGFVLPNLSGYHYTEPTSVNRQHMKTEDFLKSLQRKKNKRKKKKIAQKLANKRHEDIEKKNHKPKGHYLKFIKSDVALSSTESKLSQSKEKHWDRSPVDIIVHIKMKE